MTKRNPRPPIQVPTTYTKEQLTASRPFKGTKNSAPITVAGKTYPAETLVFVGFMGSHEVSSKTFEGKLYFGEAKFMPPVQATTDFSQIPGLTPNSPSMFAETTNTNNTGDESP